MKHIKLYEQFIHESNKLSMHAVYIHQITSAGQEAVQNFIDDYKLDGEKLADYVKIHRNDKEKYDVRDYIAGVGVGEKKNLRNSFIKKFKK